MVARNCNNCQEIYEAEPRYLNRGQGMFCSRKCSGEFKTKTTKPLPANTRCSWCGIDFYRKPSSKKSTSGHYYCSKQHQDLGATKNKLHTVGPAPSINSGRKTCTNCKKRHSNSQDICFSCERNQVIEDWLNGNNEVTLSRSSTTGLPVDTKTFVKKYLISIRGDKCEVCGFDEKAPDGRSIIQMDHVNGNCFDNRLDNLKLLCPNHHAMTPNYGSLNRGSGRAHRRKNG